MKILSISAQKPDSTGSGVYLSELAAQFALMGHQQAVVAGICRDDRPRLPKDISFYPVYFLEEGLPFPIVGMSDEMPYKSTRYCDLTEEMAKQFAEAFLDVMKRAVKEFAPDLILCHHLYLLTALAREHFPDHKIFGFCHNTDLRQMQKTDLERNYIAARIRRLDQIFVPQSAQYEKVMQVYNVKPDKIQTAGMGYNQEVFHVIGGLSKKEGVVRLVFAGKIAEKKGVMSLLRSLSYLPYHRDALILTLAGSAGNLKEYETICRMAEQAPYKVELPGRLSQPELARVYNAGDVFVLPSFFDGLPLTVVEALACGAKVVVTDLPGLREWISDQAPGAAVQYVPMPRMRNTDEAVPESLPAFERELADRIVRCISMDAGPAPDLGRISWERICERILESYRKIY